MRRLARPLPFDFDGKTPVSEDTGEGRFVPERRGPVHHRERRGHGGIRLCDPQTGSFETHGSCSHPAGRRPLASSKFSTSAVRGPIAASRLVSNESSVQQAEQLTASTGMGNGALSRAGTLRGEQQARLRRTRSACMAFSSRRTARVSRRIFAAPGWAGTTMR